MVASCKKYAFVPMYPFMAEKITMAVNWGTKGKNQVTILRVRVSRKNSHLEQRPTATTKVPIVIPPPP